MSSAGPIRDIDVIAPHFKKRLSGVTSTVVQLIPKQRAMGARIAVLGPGLPDALPHLRGYQLAGLWRRPKGGGRRVWHARRNVEMIAGILLRDVLRMPLRLLFTSAAQRHHTATTRWMIARMDAVVATSRRSGSYLKVPHTVILHGIDTEAFHPGSADQRRPPEGWPGRFLVGCSGRIRPQKGTDLFVAAMIALLPQHPDWAAVVTGRATPEHRDFLDGLKAKVAEAGLEERIRFVGEVADIKPWYRRMSLYVAPSRNEGFGLTPLEAMASGAAVVASDAGAYAEMIVPGRTGTVVPAADGPALTAAIADYLAGRRSAEEDGRAARDHVATNFALEREAAALIGIYRSLRGGAA
ncbi:MAG: glycosyltransferase family 4 protein [Pararhizobium sp.]